MRDEIRVVKASEWRSTIADARAAGLGWFDWLGCVDEIGRSDEFRVICRLTPSPDEVGVRFETRVPRAEPVLDSISGVIAGAVWHEREVRDFFGVEFAGGDNRPLLLRDGAVGRPLRRDAVLAPRVTRPWPGGKEPGEGPAAGRRRMVPPGVPDPEIWGEREGDPATPEEVAASVVGGRVRRRR